MFTIKEASARTGVSVASLRAWERRYGVVEPQRTDSGYRLYDERALEALSAMRRLVNQGWSPATAAAAISSGDVATAASSQPSGPAVPVAGSPALTEAFLDAASTVDVSAIESVLDQAFALGSFETVVDGWLMPALTALGEAWAEGRVDVAGEHAASYAVMRRLSQAFAAASSVSHGPRIVVGLPAGSHHELGALAFATAARRRGLAVVYVGADLPVDSWIRAVRAFPTRVAVLGVPTPKDRATASETAQALLANGRGLVVAAGGAHADDLAPGVVRLPCSITESARALENLQG
jgi:DNA-binding transcriptional MerR regulator/methylmalonyl-CoA mutase cobalamin-binding subunit